MIENKIYYITEEEAKKKIAELKQRDDMHVAVIDGKRASTWPRYMLEIAREFKLRTPHENYDGYIDWMSDLEWLHKNNIAMFIMDNERCLCDDMRSKKIVIDIFLTVLLPWWAEERETIWHLPRGEFNVYLVNTVD